MISWFSDGLEGRSFQATLRLYLFGLIVLAPIGCLIVVVFNIQLLLQSTPLLVISLVSIQYVGKLLAAPRVKEKDGLKIHAKESKVSTHKKQNVHLTRPLWTIVLLRLLRADLHVAIWFVAVSVIERYFIRTLFGTEKITSYLLGSFLGISCIALILDLLRDVAGSDKSRSRKK